MSVRRASRLRAFAARLRGFLHGARHDEAFDEEMQTPSAPRGSFRGSGGAPERGRCRGAAAVRHTALLNAG
jgi:hypothetical protein